MVHELLGRRRSCPVPPVEVAMVFDDSNRSKMKIFEEKGEIHLDELAVLDEEADALFSDDVEMYDDFEGDDGDFDDLTSTFDPDW